MLGSISQSYIIIILAILHYFSAIRWQWDVPVVIIKYLCGYS